MIWTRAVVISGIGPIRSLARQDPTIEIAGSHRRLLGQVARRPGIGAVLGAVAQQLDEPLVGGDPVAGELRLR